MSSRRERRTMGVRYGRGEANLIERNVEITGGTAHPLTNAANQTPPSPQGTLGAQTRRPRARYPTP